jgi:serine/threonine-protein kinase
MIEQIGKYKILEKIGEGAMGEVYKAHDPVLNRFVAIKTISAELGADDTLRKRFEREAQSAARLNHPNIITVFDYGEEQGKIYMSMELLDGSDMKQAIARRAPLSLDEKLSIVDQIAEGLAFAHAHDIVHRDLKPANVHLLSNGQAKIMDFGLARLGGSEMTRVGMVMGTPHYMSPEQVRGERADARSDVFALGCVFYELLTYRKPFDADSMHSVLFKVMQEEPPPVHELTPGVPSVLAQVVQRAMAKDPSQRFQNASEFRSSLHRAMQAVAAGQGEKALPELAPPAPGVPARTSDASASRSASAARSGPGPGAVRAASGSRPAPAGPRPRVKAPSHRGRAAPPGRGRRRDDRRAGVDARGHPAPSHHASGPGGRPGPGAGPVAGRAGPAARGRGRLPRRDAPGRARVEDRPRQQGRAGDLHDGESHGRQGGSGRGRSAQGRRAGDDAGAADALWTLFGLEPANAAADEVVTKLESSFRGRADEARRAMTAARQAAEGSKPATTVDTFKDGTDLARQGEADYKSGRFATAARRFLTARERFERALRTTR